MALQESMSRLGFAVIASVTASLIARALERIFRRPHSVRMKIIVLYILLPAIILMGPASVYGVSRWLLGMLPSEAQFRLALCASLSQIIIVYVVCRWLRKETRQKLYDERPWNLEITERRNPPFFIPVRRLHPVSTDPNDRLNLDSQTFCDGVEFLVAQINRYHPRIAPDLCVGINTIGIAIASILSERLSFGLRTVGFVCTGGKEHTVMNASLPPARKGNPRTILLTDMEMKRGNSLMNVVTVLRKRYGNDSQIYVAILVGSQVREPISRMDELAERKGVFAQGRELLPHFLAFTCFNKVGFSGNIR